MLGGDSFEKEKEEFSELYRAMQVPAHREACRKLFDATAGELNASFKPDKFVVTPNHVRAGLKWFFGRFSLSIDINDEEAAVLLNSSTGDLIDLRNQIPTEEFLGLRPDIIERLSLLLGIYGAIACIAPDNTSRFVYVAFREARSPHYGGCTLLEYLLNAESLNSWYAVSDHLHSLEAGFLG